MSESTEKEIAVKEPSEMAEAPAATGHGYSEKQIAESSIDSQESLPDLADSKQHFVPLSIEYWSPQNEGEEKRVWIHSIGNHEVPDLETGELRHLECVMMLERDGEQLLRYINASRVLVGNIKDAIARKEIVPGSVLTPVLIKFLGQKKNRSNAKLSNRWQIVPLIVSG